MLCCVYDFQIYISQYFLFQLYKHVSNCGSALSITFGSCQRLFPKCLLERSHTNSGGATRTIKQTFKNTSPTIIYISQYLINIWLLCLISFKTLYPRIHRSTSLVVDFCFCWKVKIYYTFVNWQCKAHVVLWQTCYDKWCIIL